LARVTTPRASGEIVDNLQGVVVHRGVAILLSVQNLEKAFGSYQLFRSLSFGIESGERIGLIGPNGAGKSTLLKILAELMEADDGEVIRSRGLIVGYLEQSPEFPPDITIFDAVAAGIGDDFERYTDVDEWLGKMNLLEMGRTVDTKVADLSGGWKKRVALARELVRRPDLLVLDEPTNHLDLESILWLEKLIENAKFATVIVTHDRMFLQRTSNVIFDLDRRNPNGLFVVRGSYADYLDAKEMLMASQERREVVVKNTLRRETEWLRRGAKARTTKQQARIDRHGQISDEAGDLHTRNITKTAAIDFQSSDRHPHKLIEAKGISKTYGTHQLFEPIDLLVTPKSRLGLLGANGTGKTTLIRMLLGEEPPTTGTVKLADRLSAAYFAQHRDELDPKKSVLKTLCPDGDYVDHRGSYVFARSYLDRFLFRPEQMDMPVEKLSGGEKSRLRIAQLMLKSANVLVLDEPTNDLDMATLGVLEESLRDFDGAVILVTHDRYFLDQVANEILALVESPIDGVPAKLERFADTLQLETWLESLPKTSAARAKLAATAAASAAAATAAQAPKSPGSKRKLSFKEKHELEGMEANILKAEGRLAILQADSSKPENLSNAKKLTEMTREMGDLQATIEKLYARWSELGGDG
jgi:ATP-binding cassette subfamily F protein uup